MPKEHFSVESLARLLLDLDSSVASGKLKTCTTQPVQVCHNVSFLVDIQALDDPMDIRADENGAWDSKGSPVASAFTMVEVLLQFTNAIIWALTRITTKLRECTIATHPLQISLG